MALFYLNRYNKFTTFYTDSGTLMDVLSFAEQDELISIPYLVGRHRRKNKLMYLRNKSCSNELNSCLRNYLPTAIQAKFILDSEIVAHEFIVRFQSGIIAYTDKHDLIIKLNSDERVSDVLDAFEIPLSISSYLLSQPGSLINVIKRTNNFQLYGHFKNIQDWLNLKKIEEKSLVITNNLN